MTKEEIIKHLHEALNSVDITFPYRHVLVESIEALSHPSLPSNLDEAAEEYSRRLDYYHYTGDDPSIAFKSGAEWMAGQGVKAHCVESCNPVSDSKDERLRLVTLLYAENENTPYVLAGDEIDIILRKKQYTDCYMQNASEINLKTIITLNRRKEDEK